MKLKNTKGFIELGLLAAGAIIGAFVCYVGHLPR